jgi:V/A-type H+-transporting ATPase subunit B
VYDRLIVEGAATGLDGPLLFLKRTVEAGLNEAVEVTGADGRAAALDDDRKRC